MEQSTKNSKLISASPPDVYQAFTDPNSLAAWMAPGEMTGKVHCFNFAVGGGYEMSLFYPELEQGSTGKTTANEDRYTARFTEIIPNQKIVQAITFDSADASFAGEMIMEVTFKPMIKKTEVTFLFKNIPAGINPKDNEKGTIATLEKLNKFVTKT